MASLTAIELGADCCAFARTSVRKGEVRLLAAEVLDPAAFPGSDTFTTAVRRTRQSMRLPRRCRVVVWGLPDGAHRKDAAVKPLLEPLTNAGFRVECVVSPCNALAALARVKTPRGEGSTCWLAINRGGVAIVVVRPGKLLFAHSFAWDSTIGASGSQARLLQRYSLVAFLAPEVKRAMAEARQAGTPVEAVVTCGNIPELRSLTMPLIEELDVEVETLDSLEGLIVKPAVADKLGESAPSIRLACAAALARGTRPWDPSRNRSGTAAQTRYAQAALFAAAVLGLGYLYVKLRPPSPSRSSTVASAPAIAGNRPAPAVSVPAKDPKLNAPVTPSVPAPKASAPVVTAPTKPVAVSASAPAVNVPTKDPKLIAPVTPSVPAPKASAPILTTPTKPAAVSASAPAVNVPTKDPKLIAPVTPSAPALKASAPILTTPRKPAAVRASAPAVSVAAKDPKSIGPVTPTAAGIPSGARGTPAPKGPAAGTSAKTPAAPSAAAPAAAKPGLGATPAASVAPPAASGRRPEPRSTPPAPGAPGAPATRGTPAAPPVARVPPPAPSTTGPKPNGTASATVGGDRKGDTRTTDPRAAATLARSPGRPADKPGADGVPRAAVQLLPTLPRPNVPPPLVTRAPAPLPPAATAAVKSASGLALTPAPASSLTPRDVRAPVLNTPAARADNPGAAAVIRTPAPENNGVARGPAAPLLKDAVPRVTAILVSRDRRFATIDGGQIVAIGDLLGRRTVVSMDERSVLLQEPSGMQIRIGLGGRLLGVERAAR